MMNSYHATATQNSGAALLTAQQMFDALQCQIELLQQRVVILEQRVASTSRTTATATPMVGIHTAQSSYNFASSVQQVPSGVYYLAVPQPNDQSKNYNKVEQAQVPPVYSVEQLEAFRPQGAMSIDAAVAEVEKPTSPPQTKMSGKNGNPSFETSSMPVREYQKKPPTPVEYAKPYTKNNRLIQGAAASANMQANNEDASLQGPSWHTTFVLNSADATNATFAQMCQNVALKEVSMRNCTKVTDFNPIFKLRALVKLDLQDCVDNVNDVVLYLICTNNKRLIRLSLSGCRLIKNMFPITGLHHLIDLNLSGCAITSAELGQIAIACVHIARLALNYCPNLTSISSVGYLSELRLLYCRGSAKIDSDSIVSVLNAIGHQLISLNIDGILFQSLDLSKVSPRSPLKNLSMQNNTAMVNLEWLIHWPSRASVFPDLELLDVEGCSSLRHLFPKRSCLPSVKRVRLSGTPIANLALVSLAVTCPWILSMDLSGCKAITSVKGLTTLTSLKSLLLDAQMLHADPYMNGVMELRTENVAVVFKHPNPSNLPEISSNDPRDVNLLLLPTSAGNSTPQRHLEETDASSDSCLGPSFDTDSDDYPCFVEDS